MLGLDGSEGACAAASWCAVFASAIRAAVIAVAVYTQQIELIPEDDPSSVYAYFQRKLHSAWTAPLHAADVHVETRLMRDIRASDSLRRTANEADADAIIVGNHRVGRLVHLRAGGNALRLLHTTNVPLVLVPPT